MLYVDVECYRNYFLAMFMMEDGRKSAFQMFEGETLDLPKLNRLMRDRLTVGFNSNNYDLWMIAAALEGRSCAQLKEISDEIILSNLPSWRIARECDIRVPGYWQKMDHIDIIEVAPGKASLKIYAGRLGYQKLQDLPIEPSATITRAQGRELAKYCYNDLKVTQALFEALRPQIELRKQMSTEYGVDLRSKSDAQIAEAVLRHEIEEIADKTLRPLKVDDDETFRYVDPGIVSFDSPELNNIFRRILDQEFGLSPNGSIKMPEWLRDTKIKIGSADYQMGIGGLHSCEKAQTVVAGKSHILCDFDVASYYPSIILQQGIAPVNMGDDFSSVYRSIVRRRLAAKASGDKVTANTLKIVVNGSFGKLGSKYSTLYAPNLLIQTTITGQLCLLMLIEMLESVGATVVSANTDGVVVFAPKRLEQAVLDATEEWQILTSYDLERSDYRSLHSRDVNNYIAVKPDGSVKRKGAFAEPGLMKNPQFTIVTDAIAAHLSGSADYRDVIRECRDLKKFVMLRRVTGGAVWRDQPLGKAVRFYYSTEVSPDETINYAKNSNKVPQSDGARPCLDLPEAFPDDVDVERYVGMARKLMGEMGVVDA